MKRYKTSAELKSLAKESLMGKYGSTIGLSIVYVLMIYLCSWIASMFGFFPGIIGKFLSYAMSLVSSIFAGFFSYGLCFAFLKIACGSPAFTNDIFAGFRKHRKEILKAQAYRSLLTFIGMIPCYIFMEIVDLNKHPNLLGINMLLFALGMVVQTMVTLIYNQTFYIMLDFPNYNAKEALAFSRKLMKKNKGRYLYLLVSFLPLMLLSLLTCCIGLLWLFPYMQTTYAFFYLDLIQNKH